MTETADLQGLLARVRAGESGAARELIQHYEPEVRRAIHMRIASSKLRRVIDSQDICQSVFAAFFLRVALNEYVVENQEQLFKLLVTMARNKVRDYVRKQQADRRDDRRMVGEEGLLGCVAGGASPQRVIEVRDLLGQVLGRLPEADRYLAEQRGSGREWSDLAEELQQRPDALRMRLRRSLERVMGELGLAGMDDV